MPTAVRSSHPTCLTIAQEARGNVPPQVTLLLAARGEEFDAAWGAFLQAYSRVLLKAAGTYASGYDDMLDRYTYMLDELRRHDCRRLRRYAAEARSRFSTWLLVVAKRLSVDHHRSRYGRAGRRGLPGAAQSLARLARRRLGSLTGTVGSLDSVEDPAVVDPVDALDASDRLAALKRVVANLAPEDRLLVRLRYEENLTAREIAPMVGLPTPFHVYRRLDAICDRLRCQLGDRAAAVEHQHQALYCTAGAYARQRERPAPPSVSRDHPTTPGALPRVTREIT